MKKLISLLLSALMIAGTVTGLTGCRETEEKGKVYYLNPNPETDATWQTLASQYTEETGVEVKVVTVSSGTYEDALGEKLTGDDAPTLFQCDGVQQLQQWNEYCLDLSDTAILKEMTTTDFNLTDESGAVKAIGYGYEAFGIIVNKDLLLQAGYEITDITDFSSLKAVVEDIHGRSAELGFDAFVYPDLDSSSWIRSGTLSNAPTYYRLANLPLYYELGETTDRPAAIEGTYLDAYKNIWDLIINNAFASEESDQEGIDRSLNDFGSGKAVFWQQGTWVYPDLVGSTYRMDPADLQMIPIYCGVEGEENAALCCGAENRWSVNAKAKEVDIQATLDFLDWVVTSSISTDLIAEQIGAIPFKTAKEPKNVFFADSERLIAQGNDIIPWMFHNAPDENQWRLGVASALTDYSAGNGEWSVVETAFIDGWARQYDN